VVIIGAAAYFGAGYIRRMKAQSGGNPPGPMAGPGGRQAGGTVIKPEQAEPKTESKPAVIQPNATIIQPSAAAGPADQTTKPIQNEKDQPPPASLPPAK
jgi:hypothetical protein